MANNTYPLGVDFTAGGSLNVGYISVCNPTPDNCPGSGIAGADEFFQQIMPLDQSSWGYGPLPVGKVIYTKPLATAVDRNAFGIFLKKLDDLTVTISFLFTGIVPDQMFAWVPSSVVLPPPARGAVENKEWTKTGRLAWARDSNDMNAFFAAAVAYNLGVGVPGSDGGFPPCLIDDAGASNPYWPYDDGFINGWGFDHLQNEVITPDSRVELTTIGTCPGERWISPASFVRMHDQILASSQALAQPAGAQTTPLLLISGSASADSSGGVLDAAYQLDATAGLADEHDPAGNHCLIFYNGLDELSRFCFGLTFVEDETELALASEAFAFAVPQTAGATRLALNAGATELASRTFSALCI